MFKSSGAESDFVSYLSPGSPAKVKSIDLTQMYTLAQGYFSMILCQSRQGWAIGLCLGKSAIDVGKAVGTGELD